MMKKILFIWCGLLVYTAAMAQNKDSAAVAQAVEKLREAMVSGNAADLYAITSPQLSYGHSGGAIDNQAYFVEKISSGKSDFLSIQLSEQTISTSKNVAIVRHKLVAQTHDQGKPPAEVQLKVMLVWQKTNKTWLLLARQAIKLNP